MIQTSLVFIAPGKVETTSQSLQSVAADEVRVASQVSAISSGTELLAYRGQLPADMNLDENLPGMEKAAVYPFKYGYAIVGTVAETGAHVAEEWTGQRVFAFHPHESHFITHPEKLIKIPDHVLSENALFLANMETAVGFLMDGRPMIGERVLVIGLGVVGLLTTALLLRQADLTVDTVDLLSTRRQKAETLGASGAYSEEALAEICMDKEKKYDLVYELSGNPAGLNTAITSVRDTGRIVVGSWYGTKPAQVMLGGQYHRSKAHIYASQVSSIDPRHAGRWTKQRRLDLATGLLNAIQPRQFITHLFDLKDAAEAYNLLDNNDKNVLQVVFTYSSQ